MKTFAMFLALFLAIFSSFELKHARAAAAQAPETPGADNDDSGEDDSDEDESDDDTPDPYAIEANITLASDYLVHGISQTEHEPALQGGLDWAHPLGVYLGVWGSNVRSPTRNAEDLDLEEEAGVPAVSPATLELDFYGGYRHRISETWKASFGVLYFSYYGLTGHNGWEFPLRMDWRSLYLELSSTLPQDGRTAEYLNLGWAAKTCFAIGLDAGAGYSWSSSGTHSADFHVGVAHDFLELEWKLLLSAITDRALIESEGNPRLVVSVSKAF